MNENKTLNPAVNQLICKDLELVERHLKNEEAYVKNLESDLAAAKENLAMLRKKKVIYETILNTGDATYAEPFLFESPKEFKVRE